MPSQHRTPPKAVRMPDGLLAWYENYAAARGISVNAALVSALRDFRDRTGPRDPLTTPRTAAAWGGNGTVAITR